MNSKYIALVRFLLFFLFISSQVWSSNSISAEEGPRPASFCVPKNFRNIPITKSVLDGTILFRQSSFNDQGGINYVTLTDGKTRYLSSQLWLQTKTNYQNGFETEFTMDISQIGCRSSTCQAGSMFICTYETKRSCGGDGFAFVMQSSDPKFKGAAGSGLGYSNVMSSVVVEFDAVSNKAKNDPSTDIERHVSLIAVNGQNLADEAYSFARNENPANFKNSETSNFLAQPKIKIQYLNQNWRVFINGVLQIAYYSKFPLKNFFPTSLDTWVGITASTSDVTATYKVMSWTVNVVVPSAAQSRAELTSPNAVIKSKDDFTIDIILKDECGNIYLPVEGYDDVAQATFDKSLVVDCDLMDKRQNQDSSQSYAFRFKFNCANIGKHTFAFSYQGSSLNKIDINVLPGAFRRAALNFPWGTQGSIDTGLQFYFVPYDYSKNLVDVDVDLVLSKLNVVFPNQASSSKNFQVTKQADKTFLVKFTTDIIGNYYIQDQVFIFETALGRYDFIIVEGEFDATKSDATLFEGNVNVDITKATALSKTSLQAGTQLTLQIVYRDRVGNAISSAMIQQSSMNNLQYVDGVSQQITDLRPGSRLYYSFLKVERAGQYSLKAFYKNQEIKCSNCIFAVTPLVADFAHSSLYQYDFTLGQFNTKINDNFVVNKGDPFNYKLLLRDIYDNVVNVPDVKAYTATLSGNRMKELTLILSHVENGIRLEVASGDLEYYKNLVGRKNYLITVTQVATKAQKSWNLEIKSDGSDSDSGNSDLEPLRTAFVWTNPLMVVKGVPAGTSLRAILTLKNKEGSRYNGWLDEKTIPVDLQYLDEKQGESLGPLRRTDVKGVYYVDIVNTIVLGKINTLSAKVVTITKKLLFKTIADVGYQGRIHDTALQNSTNILVDGTVNKDYNFTFMTFDKFMNPQDVDATNIVFKSKEDVTKNFPATCKRVDLGLYTCLVTPSFPGKYSVESVFITNSEVKSYEVYFRRGAPSAKTSVATVVDDVSLGIEAGKEVTLKITTRDESGLALTQDEVLAALPGFKANVKEPKLDSYTEINLVDVQANGDILAKVKLTRAGLNVFSASFNNSNLQCLVCTVSVYASAIDLSKIKMFYLSISTAGNVENPLSDTTAFMIQNTKVDPIFIMRFFDQYNNKRNYTSDLQFSGVLNVPNGAQETYQLESAGWGDAIKFIISDAQIKYFHSELKNENATGVFRAVNPSAKSSGESVNKLFLTGGSDDDIYSNDDIDPSSSKVDPTSLSFVAGEWKDINIELRTATGKLFNHPSTFGWYESPDTAFQLKLDDGESITGGIKPGKLKGTYTIHFTSYKSYINGIQMTIYYMDPENNTTYIPLTQKVKIVVHPGTLSYLVLSDPSLIKDGVAGDSKSLAFVPYDKFTNLIPKLSLTSMNFVIDSSVDENIVPKIIQNADGSVVVTYSVFKVSSIVITALKFKDKNNKVVDNYTYDILPASVNSLHSIATLDKDAISAGQIVRWKILPRDQYDNYVPLSNADVALFTASRQEPGQSAVIPVLDDPLMNSGEDGNYYYWDFNLTKAGTHEFKAYVGDQMISSNKFRCVVTAISADFVQSTLGLYKVLTSVYEEYDGDHFEQNVQALPDFKVLLFDKFRNPVQTLPLGWDMSLYLTSDELGSKYGITFCRQDDRVTFRMCTDNKLQPDLIAPAKRWADLIVPKNYTLMLTNGETAHPNFTLELLGNATDDDASNLPIDVQNTVLSPNEVHTTVNVPTSFQIFIMTTNKNLRRNEWFEKPSESIKLNFAQDNGKINYTIAYGEKKGIYKVTLLTTIAYAVKPNTISVTITDILVQNKGVKLYVNPGSPDKIYPYNATSQAIMSALPSLSIDSRFTQGFIAKDVYENVIDLNTDTPGANSIISGPSGETIAHNKDFPLDSVLMVVDFQPKVPGTYKVFFNEKSVYTFVVTQGQINFKQSTATVAPATQTAGGEVTITITPRDQFGNLLTIQDSGLFQYFVAKPTDSSNYVAGAGKAQIVNGNSVVFTDTVTIKGLYTFKTSVGGTAVTMALSRVVVNPAEVSLKDSLLQYYDLTLSKYANANRDTPIKEDNLKTYPRYLLFLADRFGNRYDEFPAELQNSFTVVLYGNDFKEASPVHYTADDLQGNALYITVEDYDKQRYQNGIYEQDPYKLSISLSTTQETVIYPVILLGEGSDDNDANIEIPLNISNTFLSKQSLSFVAGESDNFMIELRTNLGTRKADVGTPSFTFSFAQADNLKDGAFSASYINGDLRGRFIVTVTGTKANKKIGPTVLTITVNGLKVPKTVNVTVIPNVLHHADLTPGKSPVSADVDYTFVVTPRDVYNNVPLIKPADLNLIVTFPTGTVGPKDFSGDVDLNTNNVNFVVKSRYAGVYVISSQYIKNSSNFTVIPGAPDAKYTLVTVSPNKRRAGEATSITITPFDSYNNQITPLTTRGAEVLSAVSVSSVLSGDIRKYDLKVTDEVLTGSFVYTTVGLVSVVVNVNQKPVICDSCSVIYSPAAIDLSKTKFFTVSSLGVNSTEKVSFEAGRSDLKLLAQLFDQYLNSIQEITSSDDFSLVMTGNNMDSMTLDVEKNVNSSNSLDISVFAEKAAEFSRLVPADNYKLTLTYLYEKSVNQTKDLFLQLTGDDNGGGNGPYVLNMTYVNPLDLTLQAGEEGVVTVELRTKENKRFNGVFDINKLLAAETKDSYSNNDPLSISVYFGEFSGNFKVSMQSFKAMPSGKKKFVQISVDGQTLSQLVNVFITPAIPDVSKTVITQNLPFSLYSNQESETRIKLFDSYNNAFTLPDWTTKISGQAVSGHATFGKTLFDNSTNEYVVKVTAIYPPRITTVQLYFTQSEGRSFPLLQYPFISQILTQLDVTKTQLRGSELSGIPIGQDLDFNVLLLDSDGYCYESTKTIQIVISGPFKYSNKTSKELVAGASLTQIQPVINAMVPIADDASTKISVNGYECNKFYSAKLYGNQLQIAGYYQIDVYVPDVKQEVVASIRDTLMTAGDIKPASSLLSLQNVKLTTPESYSIAVNTPLVMRVQLRDAFKNVISKSDGVTFDFSFTDGTMKLDSDYKFTVLSQDKGYIDIQLLFFKVGTLPVGQFEINSTAVLWSQLDKFNFPNTIEVTSGPCSNAVPRIDNQQLVSKGASLGVKSIFTITCLDAFSNLVGKGGDKFTIQIIGTEIDTAKSETIPANVVDKGDGDYSVDFIAQWAGTYTVTVQLNGVNYAPSWTFSAKGSVCPADKPFICVNNNKCVASYKECGYPDLQDCSTSDKPFFCPVNGVGTCVAYQHECDCPITDEQKCESTKKCVDPYSIDNLCSTGAQNGGLITCPDSASFICPDGTCRVSDAECPAQLGCPPEYRLCPDSTCALKNMSCPDRGLDGCPYDAYYRCDDFSCVDSPEKCPTLVTCPKPGQILCPDKKCVNSEMECGAAPTCSNGQVLCFDTSCVDSYENCPKGVVCPVGKALCLDGSCKDSCTTGTTSRLLFRLLRSLDSNETDSSGACPANKTSCGVGGECVDSIGQCPSIVTCAPGEIKCSSMVCAKSMKECPQVECPDGQILCWDNSCADDTTECPTKISCPSKYPKLCSDGSCVDSNTDCPAAIACPNSRPFKCGSGDCRKRLSDCPTQKTCPKDHPIKCQDGSCVSNKEFCEDNVVNSTCGQDEVRCGDGSCAESHDKCSTMPTCLRGQLRCWDNKCVDTLSECTKIEATDEVCSNTAKVNCPDGSCATHIKNCPTGVICPAGFPIKCEDGNCRRSIEDCLPYTNCPGGEMYPDGTCSEGGTTVTCSVKEPYKCFDGTCRNHPLNCPEYRECPVETPIRCSSGACVADRSDCPLIKKCNGKVLCPDLSCEDSVESCHRTSGCPQGTVTCEDGSCMPSETYCRKTECPANLPLMCDDGFCVSDKKYCDLPNGCPYDLPFKCGNGLCVVDLVNCPSNNKFSCPNANDVLCADGSCAPYLKKCPLSNGCPKTKPQKCADGSCVDPSKDKCPKARCPKEYPVRCNNGLCMKNRQACSSVYNPEVDSHCKNGTFFCADGRCAPSLDQCRPVHSCGRLFTCPDGSCKLDKRACPLVNNTCPAPNTYRCENGACVSDQADCIEENGCPAKFSHKCLLTGICASNETDCLTQAKKVFTTNGCPVNTPYRDENGTCVEQTSKNKTIVVSNCSNGTVACANGTCVKNLSLCLSCPAGQFKCSDQKTCVANLDSCPNTNGCPKNKPFKCADGTCVSSFKHFTKGCKPHMPCLDDQDKWLCADGNCEMSSENCRVLFPCPNEQVRCSDLSCAKSLSECPSNAICPPTSSIRCPNGRCVDSLEECNDQLCSGILCVSGSCVNSSSYCVSKSQRNGATSRLLQTTASVIDSGCTAELPFLCGDGSCQASKDDCSIVAGCSSVLAPYRCWDGVCTSDASLCPTEEACKNGHRCEDGICRSSCPDFNGCPLSAPFQCPNGLCALNSTGCQKDLLYQCADGSLYGLISLCDRPIRTMRTQSLEVTINSNSESSTVSFITDDATSTVYAELLIPESALSNGSQYNVLKISPVAFSTVSNTDTLQQHPEKVMQVFNTTSVSASLFLRTAVFNLTTNINEFKKPLNLSVLIDFLKNSKGYDYCLAVLSKTRWECVSRPIITNSAQENSSTLSFAVSSNGVYAVIYNADDDHYEQKAAISTVSSCDWWCENKGTVLGVLIGFIASILVLGLAVYGYLKYSRKDVKGDRLLSEQDEKKLDDLNKQLAQKDKIIQETTQECNNSKENNIKLTHEIENLQAEINKLKAANQE